MGIPWKLEVLFDPIFQDKRCIKIGKASPYHIYPKALPKNPVVISAGAGADISFELELIKRFNAEVFILDPSPIGIETMAKIKNPNLKFYQLGIAGKTGRIGFQKPRGKEVCYGLSDKKAEEFFDCISLGDFLKKIKKTKIDLLKIDIEGFEYEVLEDLIRNKIDISQICLEFHHRFKNIGYRPTIKAIKSLKRAGYDLVYKHLSDYSFVKRSLL